MALAEPGFYEIRDAALPGDEPLTLAVNADRAESDLTAIDPEELASQVTSRATGGPDGPAAAPVRAVTSEELERRQGVWWYLLIAAFALFRGRNGRVEPTVPRRGCGYLTGIPRGTQPIGAVETRPDRPRSRPAARDQPLASGPGRQTGIRSTLHTDRGGAKWPCST